MDDTTLTFDSDQPIALEALATSDTTHRIDAEPIMPVGENKKAQRYRVSYRGEVLIKSTRDPEYSACRALVAMGLKKGRLEVWGPRGIIGDIERGAKLTNVENDTIGPRAVGYRPPACLRNGEQDSDCR